MPSRGVQDYEEHRKKRKEEKAKRREKLVQWCQLAGLTIIELVLCLICFVLGCVMYLMISWTLTIHYLMFPVLPIAVSCVYLSATILDLVSWLSLRPVTYFAWITISTSASIMFFLYAGICLLSIGDTLAIIGVILGIVTALVFLADLICCLLSLKRFPIPYWVLKRKFEKFDECVCTGDHDLNEEKEIERPICRCGDTWGEPCTCDKDPNAPCECCLDEIVESSCPCCTCSTQALVAEQDGTTIYGSEFDVPRKSIVTTATGRDYLIEEDPDPRKSTMVQVTLLPAPPPGVWCVNDPVKSSMVPPLSSMIGPARQSIMTQGGVGIGPVYDARSSMTYGGPSEARKSTLSRVTDAGRKSILSNKGGPSAGPSYSVYTAEVNNYPLTGFDSPSILRKSAVSGIESKKHVNLAGDAPLIRSFDENMQSNYRFSADYGRSSFMSSPFRNPKTRRCVQGNKSGPDALRYSTFTNTENYPMQTVMPDGWESSSRISMPTPDEYSLPGQVSPTMSGKNVGVTTKIKSRRLTGYPRPMSDSSIIRNVSTTVRPVRTLSSVIENPYESRSVSQCELPRRPESIPSECTITIHK